MDQPSIIDTVQSRATPSESRLCPFCAAVFSRVDAARRHAKRCPQRAGRALLSRKRGRRVQACDECSRVKVHCDRPTDRPCDRCIARNLSCTFSRSRPEISDQTQPKDQQPSPRSTPSLLEYTNKDQDFTIEKAIGEEPDGALLGPTGYSSYQSTPTPDYDVMDFIDPSILLSFDLDACFTDAGLDFSNEQSLVGNMTHPTRGEEDLLSARLNLLENELATYSIVGSHRRRYFDSAAFRNFFTVQTVHRFAATFCRKRHYQHPIIHWPTFALEEASLPLLLVVALTGATYSLSDGGGEDYIVEARKFYHLADIYVFDHLGRYLDNPNVANTTPATLLIEICQAALLMYSLEVLVASDKDIQYIAVTERLPTLISVLRNAEFIGCQHDTSEDWETFLQREQVIRVVTWTYLVDCLATLSSNKPPGFTLLEMSGHVPCDRDMWEADSRLLYDSLSGSTKAKPCSVLELMTSWTGRQRLTSDDVEDLSVAQLHIVICAIQPVLFNSHTSLTLQVQAGKLLKMLGTWRALWNKAVSALSEEDRKWIGVRKLASDLEHLTRRIIEVAIGPSASSSRYLQRVPSFGVGAIHEFIRDYMSEQELRL